MDARGGFLAIGFTALAVIAIAVVVYVATGGWESGPSVTADGAGERTRTAWPAAPVSGSPRGGSLEVGDGDEREIARLKEVVLKKEEELRSRAFLLAEREAELAELQRERDEAHRLIADLVLEQPAGPAGASLPAEAEGDPTAQDTAQLLTELDRVRERNRALEEQIGSISTELSALELELANLRGELEGRYAALLEEQRVKSSAASAALIQSGADAVPALILALESPQPAVRVWAAETLAMIGPDAREAITALAAVRENDQEEAVREAARRALAVIRD